MSKEAMKLALEALSPWAGEDANHTEQYAAYHALRERLSQPEQKTCLLANESCKHGSWCSEVYCQEHGKFVEQPEQEFTTHEEGEDGWSDWVCPDPKGYLMKCCDCGLVHEAEFGVVRYQSETEREDCDMVDDPNLQAVFRMRRSEQWSPKDTAHRAGGMPMAEQPAQQQEPEPDRVKFERHWRKTRGEKKANRELPRHPLQPQTYIQDSANRHWVTWQAAVRSVAPPAHRTWVGLTRAERFEIEKAMSKYYDYQHECKTVCLPEFARAIEAKLKEKNNG